MLKLLFGRSRHLTEFNDGYITILYLKKDHGVIVHDSLTMPISPPLTEEYAATDSNPSGTLDHEPITPMVNPASGLPMLDGVLDTHGNPFGIGDD